MPLITPIANALWVTSNLPAYAHFRRALADPQKAQFSILRRLLRENAGSAFGKTHQFDSIRDYRDFINHVPLSNYDALEPWINRIRDGEKKVLTSDVATHLIPTSGSTGAQKLIPFTRGLQREFNAALGPWLVDLTRQFPALMGGRAYWSITPALAERNVGKSAIPIGFDTDAAYLGGAREKLASAVMAGSARLGRITSVEEFRYQTLLALLPCRDLRLISVWHPSFLTLLLDELPKVWDKLLTELGMPRHLCAAGPEQLERIWPNLRVISCWGDGAASLALPILKKRFPGVFVQPKGLLATEAFVTLPFAGQRPLAVTSHFLEFIDSTGRTVLLEELREGNEYETVITTAGGLWRYRLGDHVRADGFAGKTPSLQFLGRAGDISDRFGEKLSEEFVVKCLLAVFDAKPPSFFLLAPDEDNEGCRYTLYLDVCPASHMAERLDQALRANPHYAYCRDLGQLLLPRIFLVSQNGFETYCRKRAANGARLGDIKSAALSTEAGWSSVFVGAYVPHPTPSMAFKV